MFSDFDDAKKVGTPCEVRSWLQRPTYDIYAVHERAQVDDSCKYPAVF